MVVDHRIAAHFQGVRVAVACEVREIEGLVLLHGLHRSARRDAPHQRYLRQGFGPPLPRQVLLGQLQGTALVETARQVVLRLEHRDVLVHGGQ